MNHQRNRRLGLFPWIIGILFFPSLTFAADRLVIISPHGEGIRYEFGRAFSEWHQARYGEPVEIDWRDLGGTSDDERFVISEFKQKPAGIGIDLFFGGGVDPYYDLSKRNLLQPYEPPAAVLKGIPGELGGVPVYDPKFRWFGAALSSFGILFNKRVLELQHLPVVETWRDLAEQTPVGAVGSGDPRNSGTIHMMYELILQRYGWDEGWRILTLLAAKFREFDRSAATTAKDCATGNTAYAMAIDFYALTQIEYAGKENMGFVMPKDCAIVNPDSIAILHGTSRLTLAQRFVDFTISEAGQRLWMVPRGQPGGAIRYAIERMSIRPDFYTQYRDITSVPINPFAQTMSFQYDPAKGSARWDILNGLFGATLIDVHAELVAAYKRTGRIDGKPPLTEQEAMRLAAGDWKDPHFRQRKQIEWQLWAQHKYESLASDNH